MWKLPRGMVIGKVEGDSRFSEAEHFWKCEFCSGLFDMRDLGAVLDHEGPDAPPPTCDRVGFGWVIAGILFRSPMSVLGPHNGHNSDIAPSSKSAKGLNRSRGRGCGGRQCQ